MSMPTIEDVAALAARSGQKKVNRAEPTMVIQYRPLGAVAELFRLGGRQRQVVLSGPAGTGKTRGCLEYLHLCLATFPHSRALMARKTHSSLTATALATYKNKIQPHLDGVRYFGGNASEPPQFRYPNGSILLLGGLDSAERNQKVMSSEFDIIYVNEATELTEDDWEKLDTRLRNGRMGFHLLLGDCNPNAPSHWLKQRANAGKILMLDSRHEDNPAYYDQALGAWTGAGAEYIGALKNSLTGLRYRRLMLGQWAAADGIVYDNWDPAVHMVDGPRRPPEEWTRYLTIDFGYTNPFVCQWWAVDGDGRLYRYREIYTSQMLVEDHARAIKRLIEQDKVRPRLVICDHDAEDRATLERHLLLPTVSAKKAVSPGIQAVASRLKVLDDGKPRLMLVKDVTVRIDQRLLDLKRPISTEQEIELYEWDTSAGRKRGEEPVKEHDHGCDAMRYMVMHLDSRRPARVSASVWG